MNDRDASLIESMNDQYDVPSASWIAKATLDAGSAVDAIDKALMSRMERGRRKVSLLVSQAMKDAPGGLSEWIFASRIEELARQGLIELRGNPLWMRHSEAGLPGSDDASAALAAARGPTPEQMAEFIAKMEARGL